MTTLTTLAKLKTHLGITGSGEDSFLSQLLTELDEVIAGWTGRARVAGNHPFASVESTEYLDGSGRELLALKRRPVTAIDSVYVDAGGYYGQAAGSFGSATAWANGTDYVSRSLDATEENQSLLVAIGNPDFNASGRGIWQRGRGNVKVTYTAGYVTYDSAGDPVGNPADLEMAVHRLAAMIRQTKDKGGMMAGETIGRYAYRLLDASNNIDAAVIRSAVNRYRETNL